MGFDIALDKLLALFQPDFQRCPGSADQNEFVESTAAFHIDQRSKLILLFVSKERIAKMQKLSGYLLLSRSDSAAR